MSESKSKKQQYLYIGIIVCIVVAVAAILCLLFTSKETKISDNGKVHSIDILNCQATGPEGAFFVAENAVDNKHEIKVTFQNEKPTKISYTLTGDQSTAGATDQTIATLHAKYNIYMGQYGLDPETLEPIFSNVDEAFKISLITDVDKISSATGALFFLDANEATKLKNYASEDLEKIYEARGFSCEFSK
ncbi:MAG: hypothetical protein K6G49_01470 [Candidatus Saccharibacteria bacterium]|nr:hypothetical protein [Candidatus Saccharibacteria bacterium]